MLNVLWKSSNHGSNWSNIRKSNDTTKFNANQWSLSQTFNNTKIKTVIKTIAKTK